MRQKSKREFVITDMHPGSIQKTRLTVKQNAYQDTGKNEIECP